MAANTGAVPGSEQMDRCEAYFPACRFAAASLAFLQDECKLAQEAHKKRDEETKR
jgi:hypothetical protein